MRLIERVDEGDVVAAFLRAELGSERFGAQVREALGGDRLPADPDARRRALHVYRGEYLGGIFERVTTWWRAELEPDEVLAIRYIAWDYWLDLTNGTRLPADGAARWRADGGDDRYRAGAEPLIVVRAAPADHLCVIEGHVRLTALAMHPDAIPPTLEILLGEGEAVRGWTSYGAG